MLMFLIPRNVEVVKLFFLFKLKELIQSIVNISGRWAAKEAFEVTSILVSCFAAIVPSFGVNVIVVVDSN